MAPENFPPYFGQMSLLFPFGWTCWLHFFAVEMRFVYLFYFAIKSFAIKIAVAAEMRRQTEDTPGLRDWFEQPNLQGADVEDRMECVTRGVKEALWRFWINEGDIDGCFRKGHPGPSYTGCINITAMIMCIIMVLGSFMLLSQSPSKDWRSGEYLYFTWKLEHLYVYRILARSLCLYGYLCMIFVVLCSIGIIPSEHLFLDPWNLLTLSFTDIVGILSGSHGMLAYHDPHFRWEDPEIRKQLFHRPLRLMIQQSNDEFGKVLEHAILQARCGHPKELEDLVGHAVPEPFGMHNRDMEPLFVALGAIDPEKPGLSADDIPATRGGCCLSSGRSAEHEALLAP